MMRSRYGIHAGDEGKHASVHGWLGLAVLLLAFAVAGGTDVTVETTAGETLTGSVVLGDLKLKTDFGSAVVRADQVAQITFGEPDVIETRGGDELKGELALTTLKIETADGAKTLKRKELKTLVVGGGGADRADFSGSWMLTSGNLQCPMTLSQSGLRVTGKYGFQDEFSLEGKVKGRTLSFELTEGGGKGAGTAELWEGGQYFLGGVKLGAESLLFGGYRRATKVAEAKPGEVTEGQSEAGLIYYLRVPKDYDEKRQYPLVVITHGSNTNSRGYVETFPAAWPKLAEDCIVVGVNGERLAAGSKPGQVAHNATYINFSGPEVGAPFACRQTPALLAETVQELVKRLPVDRVFLGGHSQGGFLTYATFLYYPQLFAGVFPMSCDLLVQCEPSNFKEDAIARQMQVAVAPIHGRRDAVVDVKRGDYCYQRMQEFGFPRLHYFNPDNLGHDFMFLPVEEAVRWLMDVTSKDPATLLDCAEKQLAAGQWRDAMGAVLRAREFDKAGTLAARGDAVVAAVDARCMPEAGRLADAISRKKDNSWVDDLWEFRRQFGCAPAARDCLRAYDRLKAQHTKPADDLFWAARGAKDEDTRRAKYKEIADKYYASSWWIIVREQGT